MSWILTVEDGEGRVHTSIHKTARDAWLAACQSGAKRWAIKRVPTRAERLFFRLPRPLRRLIPRWLLLRILGGR